MSSPKRRKKERPSLARFEKQVREMQADIEALVGAVERHEKTIESLKNNYENSIVFTYTPLPTFPLPPENPYSPKA